MTALTHMPLSEKLKEIPGFLGVRLLEEPKYFVLLREGNKQIRRYRPFVLAQTFIEGDFDSAISEGFFRLARYIFGNNTRNERMSMSSLMVEGNTKKLLMAAPVLYERDGKGWLMSFVLPSKYKMDLLPRPLTEDIKIVSVPSHFVATLKFRGKNSQEKLDQHANELKAWLENHKSYTIVSGPRCAQYNALYGLSFFRRNEIQITVLKQEKKRRARA